MQMMSESIWRLYVLFPGTVKRFLPEKEATVNGRLIRMKSKL